MNNQSVSNQLLVMRSLTQASALSVVIAILMAVASLAGLFFQSAIYPTIELRRAFVSNDVVNLFVGLPILLSSLALAQRGKLIGLLFWPGALFYVTYNYIAYAFAMPFTWLFALYLVLVALSVYALIHLLSRMDATTIQQQLSGVVPERLAGGVLVGFGVLFFLRSIGQVFGTLRGQTPLIGPELAVLVADFLTMPAWVIGGILLWRKQAFGYLSGAGLLFQASMLFVGLLVFFILQPFLTGTPFPVTDFVVISVMGLVCFIPFALFIRGMLSKGKQ
jgi:hypothetical protein